VPKHENIGFGVRVSAIQQNPINAKKVTSTADKRHQNDTQMELTYNERHRKAQTESKTEKDSGSDLLKQGAPAMEESWGHEASGPRNPYICIYIYI